MPLKAWDRHLTRLYNNIDSWEWCPHSGCTIFCGTIYIRSRGRGCSTAPVGTIVARNKHWYLTDGYLMLIPFTRHGPRVAASVAGY